MNKLLTLISLPLLSLGLSKCVGSSVIKVDYSIKYNPANVFDTGKRISDREININDHRYSPTENESERLKELILDAEFKSTKETNSLTTGFTYTIRIPALIWGYSQYQYHFYTDGIASITGNIDEKDENGYYKTTTYYYKAKNTESAEALYDYANSIVEDYLEDQRQQQEEKELAEQRVANFTLENALDDIRNQEKLYMDFSHADYSSVDNYVSYSDPKLEDDGTIRPLVLEATYTPKASSNTSSGGLRYTFLSLSNTIQDENGNPPLTYEITFDEEDLEARFSVQTKDKYDRDYSKSYRYNVSRTTMHEIFDNAFRLYEAKHPPKDGNEEDL